MSSYLPDEYKHLWIETPRNEAEAGWNGIVLLYGNLVKKAEKKRPSKQAEQIIIQIAEILGVSDDEGESLIK